MTLDDRFRPEDWATGRNIISLQAYHDAHSVSLRTSLMVGTYKKNVVELGSGDGLFQAASRRPAGSVKMLFYGPKAEAALPPHSGEFCRSGEKAGEQQPETRRHHLPRTSF